MYLRDTKPQSIQQKMVDLQKKFFGHFLTGENNGWDKQPPVQLNVRYVDRFELRHETEWPLARTQWTKFFLLPETHVLDTMPSKAAHVLDYDPMGDGITFRTAPLDKETEITGPVAAKLVVSSKSNDADMFLALRLFDPNGKEVTFQGSNDPHTPIGLGWLRASHRKLDTALTKPYRPYHTHDEKQPLQPGVPVELDVEIWPTCIVVPKGYTLALTVRGNDYHYDGPVIRVPGIGYEMAGVGPFVHQDPVDRPADIFGAKVTLHFGEQHAPYLLLPIIATSPMEKKS
jgi:predicted acyl esterase